MVFFLLLPTRNFTEKSSLNDFRPYSQFLEGGWALHVLMTRMCFCLANERSLHISGGKRAQKFNSEFRLLINDTLPYFYGELNNKRLTGDTRPVRVRACTHHA